MNIISGSFVAGGLEYFKKPDFLPVVISNKSFEFKTELRESVSQAIIKVSLRPEPASLTQKIIYPVERVGRFCLAAVTISLLAPIGTIVNLARCILIIGKMDLWYLEKGIRHITNTSFNEDVSAKKLESLVLQIRCALENTVIDGGYSLALLSPLSRAMRFLIGATCIIGASKLQAQMNPLHSFFTSLGLEGLSQDQCSEIKEIYKDLADLKWKFFINDGDSVDCPKSGYDASTFNLPAHCKYSLLRPFFKALPKSYLCDASYEKDFARNFVRHGFVEYGINQSNLRQLVEAFKLVPWIKLDPDTKIVMTRWKLLALTVFVDEGYAVADSLSRDCTGSPRWLLYWVQDSLYKQMSQHFV